MSKRIRDIKIFEELHALQDMPKKEGLNPKQAIRKRFSKKKAQKEYLKKDASFSGMIHELYASELFRLYLNITNKPELSPKYFLIQDTSNKSWSIGTRILPNFISFINLVRAQENLSGEKFFPHYQEIARSARYFCEIMAFNFLIGNKDPHPGNWGTLKKNGSIFAASLDYDHAFFPLNSDFMYTFLQCGHSKKILCTQEFVAACQEVIDVYQEHCSKIELLLNDIFQELDQAGFFLDWAKKEVKTSFLSYPLYPIKVFLMSKKKTQQFHPNTIMQFLKRNQLYLKSLVLQIKIEIAIHEGNVLAFKEHLKEVDEGFFTSPKLLLSRQSDRSFALDSYGPAAKLTFKNLRELIQLRTFESTGKDDARYFKEHERKVGTWNETDRWLYPDLLSELSETDKAIRKNLLKSLYSLNSTLRNPIQEDQNSFSFMQSIKKKIQFLWTCSLEPFFKKIWCFLVNCSQRLFKRCTFLTSNAPYQLQNSSCFSNEAESCIFRLFQEPENRIHDQRFKQWAYKARKCFFRIF